MKTKAVLGATAHSQTVATNLKNDDTTIFSLTTSNNLID
jgi:hypothetical protein